MVVYIRKRLNIFVCIPSGAGAEGGGTWVYGEPDGSEPAENTGSREINV